MLSASCGILAWNVVCLILVFLLFVRTVFRRRRDRRYSIPHQIGDHTGLPVGHGVIVRRRRTAATSAGLDVAAWRRRTWPTVRVVGNYASPAIYQGKFASQSFWKHPSWTKLLYYSSRKVSTLNQCTMSTYFLYCQFDLRIWGSHRWAYCLGVSWEPQILISISRYVCYQINIRISQLFIGYRQGAPTLAHKNF